MGYCEVQNPPTFSNEIDKWTRTTRDDGDEMAKPIEKLYNNTIFNKANIEKIIGYRLKDVTISAAAWGTGLTYTITHDAITTKSHVEVNFAFDSILIAQKANIRGKTETGKLILVAKKEPAAGIVIEEIIIQNIEEG